MMGKLAVLTLRVVIAIALAGSMFVQFMIVWFLGQGEFGARPDVGVPLAVVVILGIVTLQVTAVCIWKLLTMVRRGTVFSLAAFRFVDVVIGAIATGAALIFGIAVIAAYANRTTPGDEVAPGIVALVCGASLVTAGVAMIVLVLRTLLAQAVALLVEAKALQTELDEVI
jgi:hypothetical protein